jgi:hypothetical protein
VNPLDDIRNTRSLSAVSKAGRVPGPMVAMDDPVLLIWTEGPLDLELGDPPNGETPEPVGCR